MKNLHIVFLLVVLAAATLACGLPARDAGVYAQSATSTPAPVSRGGEDVEEDTGGITGGGLGGDQPSTPTVSPSYEITLCAAQELSDPDSSLNLGAGWNMYESLIGISNTTNTPIDLAYNRVIFEPDQAISDVDGTQFSNNGGAYVETTEGIDYPVDFVLYSDAGWGMEPSLITSAWFDALSLYNGTSEGIYILPANFHQTYVWMGQNGAFQLNAVFGVPASMTPTTIHLPNGSVYQITAVGCQLSDVGNERGLPQSFALNDMVNAEVGQPVLVTDQDGDTYLDFQIVISNADLTANQIIPNFDLSIWYDGILTRNIINNNWSESLGPGQSTTIDIHQQLYDDQIQKTYVSIIGGAVSETFDANLEP